jgi:hypothetical protein
MEQAMNKLKQQLRTCLPTNDIQKLLPLIRQFKEQGGSRDDAYRVLQELRAEQSLRDHEDLILELMDVVSGFCPEHLRIWS